MKTLGRFVAAFLLMVAAGYVAVVVLVPAPSEWRPDDASGQSAAARLTQEAQGLVSHRSMEPMQ